LEGHLLGDLLLVIALAAAGVALFERLGLPSIAGFLVMGALVGPGALGIVDDPDSVRALAEFGVVFLLFEIGLELPFERIREIGVTAAIAGGLQVGITLTGAAWVAWMLGVPPSSALAIGGLVAMSSTALVMGLLSEHGVIDAPQGRLSVAILLFQDLCIVPLLLAVPILAAGERGSGISVALALGRAALAMVGMFVVARFVVPWLLERAARLRSRDLFSLLALLIVVGSAVIAEGLGLTLAVGAFIGGMVASASPYAYQMFAELVPLRGVFIGLFFTAMGMLFDPAATVAAAPLVVGWVLAVMFGKALVVAGVVGLVLRRGVRLAVLTGLGLAQTGEFSFVLAAAAGSAGLLTEEFQDVFIAGSVLTLVATPFLFRVAPRVAGWFARRDGPAGAEAEGDDAEALRDHVVLLGFGLAGQNVARVLRAIDVPYAAVESNAHAAEAARERGERVVWGDATRGELLRRLGVERARLVVVALSDPIATREAVALVHSRAPEVTLLVKTRWQRELDSLSSLGADTVVSEELEGTLDLVGEVLRVCGVAEGAVARFARELREEGYQALRAPTALGIDPWLAELLQESPSDWLEVPDGFPGEATLAELEVRARTGATILAVERDGVPTPGPQPDFALRAGDRVLAFGDGSAIERLRELLGDPPGR
jgi:CPA2 family monovalent cation:H+ antiporter-2